MGRDDVAQERNVVLYKHVFLDGPVNLQHGVDQSRTGLVHKGDALGKSLDPLKLLSWGQRCWFGDGELSDELLKGNGVSLQSGSDKEKTVL